jgi:hypothetical protein
MLNVSIEKPKNNTVYADMKKGDMFSWPTFFDRQDRAVGLKLQDGFVWIHSTYNKNQFLVEFDRTNECVRELSPDVEVEYEGKLIISEIHE